LFNLADYVFSVIVVVLVVLVVVLDSCGLFPFYGIEKKKKKKKKKKQTTTKSILFVSCISSVVSVELLLCLLSSVLI
jgi:uncharacterized membrane protein YidH (DUF202 family)